MNFRLDQKTEISILKSSLKNNWKCRRQKQEKESEYKSKKHELKKKETIRAITIKKEKIKRKLHTVKYIVQQRYFQNKKQKKDKIELGHSLVWWYTFIKVFRVKYFVWNCFSNNFFFNFNFLPYAHEWNLVGTKATISCTILALFQRYFQSTQAHKPRHIITECCSLKLSF